MPFATATDGAKLYYEVAGSGPAVVLGPHVYATPMIPVVSVRLRAAYEAALTDAYTVITFDPRGNGKTRQANDGRDVRPGMATPEQATADLHAITEAAGFQGFGYSGYSGGGSFGLRMAAHSDRFWALAIGGWPPLGGPWQDMLTLSNKGGQLGWEDGQEPPPAARALGIDFYTHATHDERAELQQVTCPRLVYMGTRDTALDGWPALWGQGNHPLAQPLRDHADGVRAAGWTIVWFPRASHMVFGRPSKVAPVLRTFFDRHRPESPL